MKTDKKTSLRQPADWEGAITSWLIENMSFLKNKKTRPPAGGRVSVSRPHRIREAFRAGFILE